LRASDQGAAIGEGLCTTCQQQRSRWRGGWVCLVIEMIGARQRAKGGLPGRCDEVAQREGVLDSPRVGLGHMLGNALAGDGQATLKVAR
jgi:hypothetical protein